VLVCGFEHMPPVCSLAIMVVAITTMIAATGLQRCIILGNVVAPVGTSCWPGTGIEICAKRCQRGDRPGSPGPEGHVRSSHRVVSILMRGRPTTAAHAVVQ
jgi:hypothetical protein